MQINYFGYEKKFLFISERVIIVRKILCFQQNSLEESRCLSSHQPSKSAINLSIYKNCFLKKYIFKYDTRKRSQFPPLPSSELSSLEFSSSNSDSSEKISKFLIINLGFYILLKKIQDNKFYML